MDLAGEDSIYCLSNKGNLYVKSDASLNAMKMMTAPYSIIASVMLMIPSMLRNIVYDAIGRRRYKIFGKKDVCYLPEGDRAVHFPTKLVDLPDSMRSLSLQYFEFKQPA